MGEDLFNVLGRSLLISYPQIFLHCSFSWPTTIGSCSVSTVIHWFCHLFVDILSKPLLSLHSYKTLLESSISTYLYWQYFVDNCWHNKQNFMTISKMAISSFHIIIFISIVWIRIRIRVALQSYNMILLTWVPHGPMDLIKSLSIHTIWSVWACVYWWHQ